MPIFGRKKADKQGMSDVLENKKATYTIQSRRAKNPHTGDRIKKGSSVTAAKTGRKFVGFDQHLASTKLISKYPSVRSVSSVKPADMAQGKVIMRSTQQSDAKRFNERPEKVAARMKAQSDGKTSYNDPKTGKSELSGVETSTVKKTPGSVKIVNTTRPFPMYEKENRLKVKRPMPKSPDGPKSMTFGGSTKGDHPATKTGIGTKKRYIKNGQVKTKGVVKKLRVVR